MDEEPAARALLVAGVTYMTVGLVTLALGIVFVVVDFHASNLVVVWAVAIASGLGAMVAGAQLSSLTCHGRSVRPATAFCVALFTGTTVIAVGAQVSLLVLSSFHVMKDGSRREIFIFFIVSSTIQMIALVVAPLLLLTCNSKIMIPTLSKSKQQQKKYDAQDNYGFIGDSEMWCSSRPTRNSNLTRWPGMEHLEKANNVHSSTSSVGSIHPGHYIAGDHHHKFIGPSSEEGSNSSSPTPELQRELQSPTPNGLIYAEVHTATPPNDRTKISSHPSRHPESQSRYPGSPSRLPVRPPRQRDSKPNGSPSGKRSERITVSTVSRSYSPLGSPPPKRIYLYDPVELEIVSPALQRSKWHSEKNGALVSSYDDWVPRKGIFAHNLHGINVNGLHSLRPSESTSLPGRRGRPRDPPPVIPPKHRGSDPLPNGIHYRFEVGEWEDLNSPLDGVNVQATSTPKHTRKVTFVESYT